MNKSRQGSKQICIWQAVRDVLIEAMRRGQLPFLACASLILLFLWKTPQDYYPSLWEQFFDWKGAIMIASIVFNVALTFGWYWHSKSLRNRFKDENLRIIAERNSLQKGRGVPVKSSKR